jgi:hypothetical protein
MMPFLNDWYSSSFFLGRRLLGGLFGRFLGPTSFRSARHTQSPPSTLLFDLFIPFNFGFVKDYCETPDCDLNVSLFEIYSLN